MRIERVNENKIKIEIDAGDIRAWNVDIKNFTDNTPEAQDMFWHALKQAERDVDFRVGKSQLMVETVPSSDNGFTMLVSKIKDESEIAEALIKSGKRVKQAEFRIQRRKKSSTLLRIFRFADFESLCDGIHEIYELYMGESRLIKYQGSFYLELRPRDSFGLFELENQLSEFAERIANPLILQGVLNEHGLVMMKESAVSLIADNFIKQ